MPGKETGPETVPTTLTIEHWGAVTQALSIEIARVRSLELPEPDRGLRLLEEAYAALAAERERRLEAVTRATGPEPAAGELVHCHGFRPDHGGGPAQYTRFVDLNGRDVMVKYSSAAATAAVWIFTGPAEAQRMAAEAAGVPAQLIGGSAHLCRAMAREVRDGLNAFLDDPVAPELACETRVEEG